MFADHEVQNFPARIFSTTHLTQLTTSTSTSTTSYLPRPILHRATRYNLAQPGCRIADPLIAIPDPMNPQNSAETAPAALDVCGLGSGTGLLPS